MCVVDFVLIFAGHFRVLLLPAQVGEVPQVPPCQEQGYYHHNQRVDAPK